MFDGTLENPLALILLVVTAVVAGPFALWSLTRNGDDPRWLAALGMALLLLMPTVLLPLHVLNVATGESMLWLFGREAADTGVVEFATFSLFACAAGLGLWLARTHNGLERLTYLITAAVLAAIAGEEISWGQWIFHWASPTFFAESNLQGETNAHNFLGPGFIESGYAIAGAAILVLGLTLRFGRWTTVWLPSQVRPLRESRVCLPLALCAAVFMQHPFVQELSELALAAAAAHAMAWLGVEAARRTRPHRGMAAPVPAA